MVSFPYNSPGTGILRKLWSRRQWSITFGLRAPRFAKYNARQIVRLISGSNKWILNLQGPSFETQDGLFDLAWSETHENQLVTASGDGSIRMWDVMLKVISHS